MQPRLRASRSAFVLAAVSALSTGACEPNAGAHDAGIDRDARSIPVPRGEWVEVPNSRVRDVLPPASLLAQIAGNPVDITEAWNSGAFDDERGLFYVHGGGHNNYAGNEVYAFSLDSLTWERLIEPTVPADHGTTCNVDRASSDYGYMKSDGRPCAIHTYDGLEVVSRRFCRGVAPAIANQDGNYSARNFDCFDPDSRAWARMPSPPDIGSVLGNVSSVDAAGNFYLLGSANTIALGKFDVSSGSWTSSPLRSVGFRGYGSTAAIVGDRMLLVGGGGTAFVSLGGGDVTTINPEPQGIVTSGATEIEAPSNPGVALHTPSGQLFAWHGGTSVYALELGAGVWTRYEATGSVVVPDVAGAGVFGRFRYSETQDVFVLVNSIDDNVFLYRP